MKSAQQVLLASGAALALLAVPASAQQVSLSPQQALEGYYAALEATADLPLAPPGLPVDSVTGLSRIAFGSCNSERRSQHMWGRIAATDPQLFLLIGDNVYGDTEWDGDAGLGTLRAAYAAQSAHREFAEFRGSVPMLTTWDDHDYGFNDAGGEFAFKGWAETIYEHYWGASDTVRSRPGIYESRMFGAPGERVQIILLDTRYFRTDLARLPWSEERRPLGNYAQDDRPAATMLGQEQWDWLAQELAKPADLRIVVSSIQVLTQAHDFESWDTMPAERERLLDMLAARQGGGLLLLSGDRHAGGLYRAEHRGEPMWELTSSSLNLAFNDTAANTAREPDPSRVTDLISEENFGTIDIDWRRRSLTVRLLGNAGEERVARTLSWTR